MRHFPAFVALVLAGAIGASGDGWHRPVSSEGWWLLVVAGVLAALGIGLLLPERVFRWRRKGRVVLASGIFARRADFARASAAGGEEEVPPGGRCGGGSAPYAS